MYDEKEAADQLARDVMSLHSPVNVREAIRRALVRAFNAGVQEKARKREG